MALRTPLPVQPNMYMTDTAGRPLDGGKVYFGQVGKDPEFYPIDVFYDRALTVVAAQPIRTKNGFLNNSGNTVGIYASNPAYSVKVLDAHGQQVFYISDMTQGEDFNAKIAAEMERAKTAEQENKSLITAEATRSTNKYTEIDSKTAALDAKDIELQDQINSIGGGAKAYTTYAKMVAAAALPEEDPLKLRAGDKASVVADADATKNGDYAYDGTTFTESDYDPLALAKDYTDRHGELSNKIVASNIKSQRLDRVASVRYGGVGYISSVNYGKFSYLLEVDPGTTYTILVKSGQSQLGFRSFDKAPDTWYKHQQQDYDMIPSAPTITSDGATVEFTTGPNTHFVVCDPLTYANFVFIVCKGTYAASMWRSFSDTHIDKTIVADTLIIDTIKSPMFVPSKNMFNGYAYGVGANPTSLIGEVTSKPLSFIADYGDADYERMVSCFIPVNTNTTYTISKEPSDLFDVALMNADRNSGRVMLRDPSKLTYTVTTGATDRFMQITLSRSYQKPLVQIELGEVATQYESRGCKLKDAAQPLGFTLGDLDKLGVETDNTYINLGQQTTEFQNTTYTTETILNKYYEPLLADYPHLVSKNLLSKDASGQYDIYEYIFEPDSYEQTILLTSGMHPTESVPPFALGILLNEIYRNPDKHEGLAYLRNSVKIVVIPVINVWGMNQNPRQQPLHYNNVNGVNLGRNFDARWAVNPTAGDYNKKGVSEFSEIEARNIRDVLKREKDELSFFIDTHTGEGWEMDSMVYYLDEDDFLRPVIDKVVSMQKDIIYQSGRTPKTEVRETWRATQQYYSQRVLGIPAATIEFGAAGTWALDGRQTTYYTNQLFNFVHYALKAKLKDKRVQAEKNEQNKPFISLYNTLAGHNELINEVWNYAEWQTNLYDKLGLTRSIMGAASGTYDLVKYTHAPTDYKNTIVLSAGASGSRKSVTTLGFIAHKLMTDSNPHIVELRSSTRFIFIPCLNPYGYDNKKTTNANNVDAFADFATSSQPEAVALKSLVDAGGFDLYVDLSGNTNLTTPSKPTGYADLQVVYNNKADSDYQAVFNLLSNKYGQTPNVAASKFSSSITKSNIAAYINSKNVAYEYVYIAQNVLPKRTTEEGLYVDYGYEADELAYNAEVVLNSIKALNEKLMFVKYLSA